MEVQLKDLIDKIKKDGILVADEKADEIVRLAEEEAKKIIEDARNKADDFTKKAELEANRFDKAAQDSIKQAARNTLIAFKQGVVSQLEAIVNTETEKTYDAELLKRIIPDTVVALAKTTGTEDLSIILSEKNLKNIEKDLVTALKSEISKGVEIKTDKKMSEGFKVGTKDGVAYYDFSAEAVADIFNSYLSPKTAEILKSAAKEI